MEQNAKIENGQKESLTERNFRGINLFILIKNSSSVSCSLITAMECKNNY